MLRCQALFKDVPQRNTHSVGGTTDWIDVEWDSILDEGYSVVRMHRDFGVFRIVVLYHQIDKTTRIFRMAVNPLDRKSPTESVCYTTSSGSASVGFITITNDRFAQLVKLQELECDSHLKKHHLRCLAYDPIFGYVEHTHDRKKYVTYPEYSIYPDFLISTFNGLNRVWKYADRSTDDNVFDMCCQRCLISDDRESICMPALDVLCNTKQEIAELLGGTVELRHLRMLAWRIPARFRKFFCRASSGKIIPIVYLYRYLAGINRQAWLKQLQAYCNNTLQENNLGTFFTEGRDDVRNTPWHSKTT